MSSIEEEARTLEREVNALSANQAPNPADIATFVHSIPVSGEAVVHATFPGGLRLFQTFLSPEAYMDTEVSGNVATFTLWAYTAMTLTVVSLSEFTLA